MYRTLHDFYVSKQWTTLCSLLKKQRGMKCERSGKRLSDQSLLIGHHIIPLTMDNVHDANIALNPNNIEIISVYEHNREHRRFGYRKQVYIVWGSPYSGRHTAVRQMMRTGDIVLDIDTLWDAITIGRPNACRYNVFKLWDSLFDQIKTRYGQWCDAYVIGTYADRYERDRVAQELGAELIHCESTKDDCIRRAVEAGDTTEYVVKWWEQYERNIPPASQT